MYFRSLQCAPSKQICCTSSVTIDLWQLCSSKQKWNHRIGLYHDFSAENIAAPSNITHMHRPTATGEMLKAVDKRKILSSQTSFTDHSRIPWKDPAVRQIRLGVTLYLTQALWYVMGVHRSHSNSPPLCSSPTHASYKTKCAPTRPIRRYLYSQRNACFAGFKNEKMLDLQHRVYTPQRG